MVEREERGDAVARDENSNKRKGSVRRQRRVRMMNVQETEAVGLLLKLSSCISYFTADTGQVYCLFCSEHLTLILICLDKII